VAPRAGNDSGFRAGTVAPPVSPGDRRNVVLAAATVANFGRFGARVVLSPLVLAITLDFGVTKGGVGSPLTLMWAAFALAVAALGTGAGLYFAVGTVLLARRFE